MFGEHAVVYGQPALAAAIDVKTEVTVEPVEEDRFEVLAEGVGRIEGEVRNVDGSWSIEDKKGDVDELSFVTKVSELTFNYLGEAGGLRLLIESDLPTGSGLGSSSAVTTAASAAVSSGLGRRLSREEISDLAYKAEVAVQGAASRTGVNVASHGGFMKIQEEEREGLKKLPEITMLIGYTGQYANTGEIVAGVRKLKKEMPWIVNPIVETIGKITEVGISSLEEGNMEKLGTLMNANQNLLEGLRVSSPKLRQFISSARKRGALGSKLTGAGGGGCMIALGLDNMDELARVIEDNGGEAIKARIGTEGLNY